MKKILFGIALLIIALLIAAWIAWANRAHLVAHYISSHLQVPVTINTLDISKTEADLTRFWIGNPPHSKTSTSFSAENIEVFSTLDQIRSDPLVIDEIDISNIFVGLEYYKDGQTNWNYILKATAPSKKKTRDYLIRTLILTNLTVEVTQANGQTKRYPTLARMEFHNISSDTGFPVQEIEKAIFNQMMKELFQRFNFQDLLKNLPGAPLQYLPDLFK